MWTGLTGKIRRVAKRIKDSTLAASTPIAPPQTKHSVQYRAIPTSQGRGSRNRSGNWYQARNPVDPEIGAKHIMNVEHNVAVTIVSRRPHCPRYRSVELPPVGGSRALGVMMDASAKNDRIDQAATSQRIHFPRPDRGSGPMLGSAIFNYSA